MAQTNTVSVFVQMTTVTASGVADRPEEVLSHRCILRISRGGDYFVPGIVQGISGITFVLRIFTGAICQENIRGSVVSVIVGAWTLINVAFLILFRGSCRDMRRSLCMADGKFSELLQKVRFDCKSNV